VNEYDRLQFRASKAFGEGFEEDSKNFYVTEDNMIVWAKHEHTREGGEKALLAIPFDSVTADIDELIDAVQLALKRAPYTKQLLDRRADAGSPGDVGALMAALASKATENLVDYARPALDAQLAAREKALRELKALVEPISIELEALLPGGGAYQGQSSNDSRVSGSGARHLSESWLHRARTPDYLWHVPKNPNEHRANLAPKTGVNVPSEYWAQLSWQSSPPAVVSQDVGEVLAVVYLHLGPLVSVSD
jgi:hypothetical protein